MPKRPPAVLCLLAAALCVHLSAAAVAQARPQAAARPDPAGAAAPAGLRALDAQLDLLSRQVAPSVVQVLASGYTSTPSMLLARGQATGSGVIVDAEGWIVTNAHVVENARSVRVDLLQPPQAAAGGSILRPRSRRLAARVVGLDRETDLAVLKVEERGLPALELGDSESLRQGQLVMAFGSPLGLENSASLGVVSAVARQLKPDDPMIYVQTDASINPGNSGGPLVDAEGRMVGLNTLILSQSGGNEGIGFAAPSNIVLALDGKPMQNARQFDVNLYRRAPGDNVTLTLRRGAESLELAVGVVARPEDADRFLAMVTPEKNLILRLGVLALELDDELRRAAGPLRGREGVLVAARSAGAEDSGDLRPGDVVYSVNGVSVLSLSELRSAVGRPARGQPIVLHIERGGRLLYVVVEAE